MPPVGGGGLKKRIKLREGGGKKGRPWEIRGGKVSLMLCPIAIDTTHVGLKRRGVGQRSN